MSKASVTKATEKNYPLQMSTVLILIILFCALACQNKESSKDESTIMKESKWLIYAINGDRKLQPLRMSSDFRIDQIQCKLDSLNIRKRSDTVEIWFRYSYHDTDMFSMEPIYIDAIGTRKDSILYPISSGDALIIISDSTDTIYIPQRTYSYIQDCQKDFIRFLENYPAPEKINPWLYEEMKRRGIKNKHEN